MRTGIVLAGGKASRVGKNKLLMHIDDKPVIFHVIDTMRDYVDNVVVVVGHYAEELTTALASKNVTIVINTAYDRGMFSSVLAGLPHAQGDVIMLPGDMPLIAPTTYEALLRAEGNIRVPSHQGRRGHPIFLAETHAARLLEEPVESNVKAFRNRHPFTTVPVEDEGILVDFDTRDDFKHHAVKERD